MGRDSQYEEQELRYNRGEIPKVPVMCLFFEKENKMQELGPLQTKFVEALESGSFQQTKGSLLRDGRYCCLGVACATLGITPTPYSLVEGKFCFDGNANYTTLKTVDAYKFKTNNGATVFGDIYDKASLESLNDSGKTFAEIAAIIRRDPSAYFYESA